MSNHTLENQVIKKGAQYAVPYLHNRELPILSFFKYLIDKQFITDNSIINTYQEALSMCQTDDKGVYSFQFIHLKLYNKPPHAITSDYSLEQIEQSYQQALKFDRLYQVIFMAFLSQKKLLNKLKNSELLTYYPFENLTESLKTSSWYFKDIKEVIQYEHLPFIESTKFYFDNLFLYNFRDFAKIWEGVINEKGHINCIETINLDIPLFSETVYVIYSKGGWNDSEKGYAQNHHSGMGNLATARFYQSVDTAKKSHKNATVVEVKLEFQKIAHQGVQVSNDVLEAFTIKKEQEKLSASMQQNNIQALAEQIVNVCEEKDEELKNYLIQYLAKQEKTKKSQKI
jgi:hypothetical protein